jgi:uncharacterized protein YaaQ
MARLIVAVVSNLDAERVVDVLRNENHRLTEVPSFGGLFHAENTTLLIGVEDEETEKAVLEIVRRECAPRDLEVPADLVGRRADLAPVVHQGGATVFLVELSGILRL